METTKLVDGINTFGAKLMAIEIALQEVIRALPADAKTEIAGRFRQRLASAMQEHAHLHTAAMDQHMTSSAAAILEAAGEPPQR